MQFECCFDAGLRGRNRNASQTDADSDGEECHRKASQREKIQAAADAAVTAKRMVDALSTRTGQESVADRNESSGDDSDNISSVSSAYIRVLALYLNILFAADRSTCVAKRSTTFLTPSSVPRHKQLQAVASTSAYNHAVQCMISLICIVGVSKLMPPPLLHPLRSSSISASSSISRGAFRDSSKADHGVKTV